MADPEVSVQFLIAGGWEDVTEQVRVADGILISTGQRQEAGEVTHGSCVLTLDNKSGDWSNRNPASPYFGLIGRNTPMRVWVGSDLVFTGEVSEWPQRWNVTGSDVTAPIEAAGILRRLLQGAKALQPALYRAIAASHPVAFWPLTDASSATVAAPWQAGQPVGVAYGDVRFAGAPDTLSGSAVAVAAETPDTIEGAGVDTRGNLDFAVPGHALGPETLSFWTQGSPFAQRPDTAAVQVTVVHRLAFGAGGGLGYADVMTLSFDPTGGFVSSIGYWIQFFDPTGAFVAELYTGDSQPGWDPFDGTWHEVQVRLDQSGADIDAAVYVDGVVGDSITISSRTLTPINEFRAGVSGYYQDAANAYISPYRAPYSLASLSVHNTAPASFWTAGWGHSGETAARRIERLCDEEGVALDLIGPSADTAPVGPQRADTFVALLRDAARADGGILGEAPYMLGLTYRSRSSLYNQAPILLDYTGQQVAPPLLPVDDDQVIWNTVTVHRASGGTYRALALTGPLSVSAPPDGVGVYDRGPLDVAVESDAQLPDVAGWLRHLGTWDEARYPSIGVNLSAPALAANPALTANLLVAALGDLVAIENPPASLPPETIVAMCRGVAIDIGSAVTLLRWSTTPAGPWTVVVADTATYGILDTAGSTLAENLDTTETGVDVTSPGAAWSSATPYDIAVAGERMTVTAVAGAGPAQTLTVARSVNGLVKAHPSGTQVRVWTPAVLAR